MAELNAFFLVGPTAVGKTTVSQWIAEQYNFDILSADAMLVYRGLDIGTAKPLPAWREKVRYGGLDLAELQESFSAGKYRAHALNMIRESVFAGRRIIITGGTGLYVKSLTHGLTKLASPDVDIRGEAEKIFQDKGLAGLQAWAKKLAPQTYEAIVDKKNPRRLVRAVEIYLSSDRAGAAQWKQIGQGPVITGLCLPMAQLYERIESRVKEMYAGGLLEEVARLLKKGLSQAPTAAKAIGYAEAINLLNGKISLAEAMQATAQRTRHLAKRQMTWFKHQANVEWLELESGMPVAQIAAMVMERWKKTGPTRIVE